MPRRVLRLAGCLAVVMAGLLLAPPVRRWAGARAVPLLRVWVRLGAAALGVRIRVLDLSGRAAAADGPELLVANHVSWLDVLLVQAVRPGRMLAKAEVAHWPVVGRAAGRWGTVFLDRERPRALPGAVAEVAGVLRGGGPAVVFPEGTTWCGARTGPFRAAFFQAALDAGAPVRPMAVRYRLAGGRPATVPAFVGDDDLVASLRRVVAVRGLVAELVLLPAIPPGAAADRRELAAAAQRAVERVLSPDPRHRRVPDPVRGRVRTPVVSAADGRR
ncbi:lysophospholipid acyltransferase family protein [Streptacidiphilus griseoplanus]|uniref:lysophospholipid acyltransferase family protein n=1 Tax=Peterkaempfera griseoplana TaxID=66896 RepID=UPI001FE1163F|nr:lysophospholipid acyltransferase family protein [Peterkaempfera griseoplana]